MHTEKREDPLVELGYEIRDVNTNGLLKGTIGFFLFTIASGVIGFVIFRLLFTAGFSTAAEPTRLIPQAPNPIVQSNITAKTDIMDLRQQEDAKLNGPIGWVDASKTKLHIPIERAMDIIAERGVPKTGADVPAQSKGHTPDTTIGEKSALTGPAGGTTIKINTPLPLSKPVPAPVKKN